MFRILKIGSRSISEVPSPNIDGPCRKIRELNRQWIISTGQAHFEICNRNGMSHNNARLANDCICTTESTHCQRNVIRSCCCVDMGRTGFGRSGSISEIPEVFRNGSCGCVRELDEEIVISLCPRRSKPCRRSRVAHLDTTITGDRI